MAQQGSFLYKLKVDLDLGDAVSDFNSRFNQMAGSVTSFTDRVEKLQQHIQSIRSTELEIGTSVFADELSRARRQIERTDQSLENLIRQGSRLETMGGQAFADLQTPAQQKFRSQTPSMGSGASQALRKNLRQVRQRVTSLDGRANASVEQLANSFTGLNSDVSNLQASLSTLMGNLEATGQSLKDLSTDNPFDHLREGARSVPRSISEIRQEILQSDSSLQELAATADRSWGRITNGALEAAEGADRMGASIVQNAEQAEQSLKGMQSQMVRSRGATYSLGSTASSAASQLSVDLTQSAQDAAFGIENLAASAPFLQEQFGRVKRQAGSFTGALADIGSALMGPTGVIAAFTLLLTFKDEIISFFGNITDKLTESSTKFEEFQDTIEDTFEKARQEAKKTRAQEFANFVQQLTPDDKATDVLESRLDTVTNLLDEFNTKREEILQNMQESREETLEQARENVTEDADITTSEAEFLSADASDTRETPSETSVTAGVRQTPSARAARKAREQLSLTSERIAELQRQKKDLQEVTEEVGFESMEEARVRERLSERYGIQGEKLDKLTNAYMDFREEQEKANEEAKKEIEYQERLRELRVEAMEEGLDKQIAKIEASTKARTEEIKALNLQAEKEDKLLKLLRESAELQKERAFEDSVTLSEPEGGDGMPLMIRNPTDTGPAFVELENATDQVKKAQQKMNERLDRERQRLRDERRFGATRGALEELGSMQIQFQLDMMEKEENLRLKRLKKQRDFIRTRADIQEILGNQSEADRLNAQAEAINSQIASVEQKWYNKRLQQQQEFLGKQIRNIETTPLGDAYRGLFLDVGSVLQGFYSESLNWQKKNMAERASIIGEAGTQVVGAVENIATQSFNSWLSVRQQELKAEGKSQEERTEIIKKEGKRRFQFMKAMKIAEASMAGLTGAINAYVAGTNLSKAGVPAPIPHIVGLSLMGASLAATGAKISKIAGMSIGDKLGGGGAAGGGGGARGGQFTQRAAASSATAAGRVGTEMQAQRNNDEDKINKTAERVGEEVGKQMPDRVTMDDDTAEQANDAAVNQKNKLNK